MRKLSILIIGLLIVSGLTFSTLGEDVDAKWTVDGVTAEISLSAHSVVLDTPSGNWLLNTDAHDITVNSNGNWTVQVKEDDGTIDYTGSFEDPNEPVGDFEFTKYTKHGHGHNSHYDSSYVSLSDSNQEVRSGSPTGGNGTTFSMGYKVKVEDDVPGSYTATLVYTVSTT